MKKLRDYFVYPAITLSISNEATSFDEAVSLPVVDDNTNLIATKIVSVNAITTSPNLMEQPSYAVEVIVGRTNLPLDTQLGEDKAYFKGQYLHEQSQEMAFIGEMWQKSELVHVSGQYVSPGNDVQLNVAIIYERWQLTSEEYIRIFG